MLYSSLWYFVLLLCVPQIKSQELFDDWVSKLRHHRLYRQNEIAMYPTEKTFYYTSPSSPNVAKNASFRRVHLSTTQMKNYMICCLI